MGIAGVRNKAFAARPCLEMNDFPQQPETTACLFVERRSVP
jgi:hypothetical protein